MEDTHIFKNINVLHLATEIISVWEQHVAYHIPLLVFSGYFHVFLSDIL